MQQRVPQTGGEAGNNATKSGPTAEHNQLPYQT
jgi:hypothetical protein